MYAEMVLKAAAPSFHISLIGKIVTIINLRLFWITICAQTSVLASQMLSMELAKIHQIHTTFMHNLAKPIFNLAQEHG